MTKKREAAQDEMTAEEVYAELAAEGVGVQADQPAVEPAVDPEKARLRQQIADLEAKIAAVTPKRVLDPEDPRLDEPVIPTAPRSRLDKTEEIHVATFRELGVHPDDLDEGLIINPETGGIVKCMFIKKSSGNLVEMP